MELEINQEIGSYRITGHVGRGGMGMVYRARHTRSGGVAAVKVLRSSLCENQRIVRRFFNEARAASAIMHPGIITIYDVGDLVARGQTISYIVMELLEGEALDKRIRRLRKLSIESAISISRQVTSALSAAHDKGIVHRDLKPENVMLVRDPDIPGGERIKLLDFGVAKLVETGQSANSTRSGSLLGTPLFMAPEQCRGEVEVDGRADLYALGCMIFTMVCGRPPFYRGGPGQIMADHIHAEPESPRELEPCIPRPLESLILRLLRKNPKDRFHSANDVASALQRSSGEAVPSTAERESSDQTTLRFGSKLLAHISTARQRTKKRLRNRTPRRRSAPSPEPLPDPAGPPTLDMRRNKGAGRSLPLPAVAPRESEQPRLRSRRSRLPGVAEIAATNPVTPVSEPVSEPISEDGPTIPAYARPAARALSSQRRAGRPAPFESDDDDATVVDPSVPAGLARALVHNKASARKHPAFGAPGPAKVQEAAPLPPPPRLASPPPLAGYPPAARSLSTISNAVVTLPQRSSDRRRHYAVVSFFAVMLVAVIFSMVFLDTGPFPGAGADGGTSLGAPDARSIVPTPEESAADLGAVEASAVDAGLPEASPADAASSPGIEPRRAPKKRPAKSKSRAPQRRTNGNKRQPREKDTLIDL